MCKIFHTKQISNIFTNFVYVLGVIFRRSKMVLFIKPDSLKNLSGGSGGGGGVRGRLTETYVINIFLLRSKKDSHLFTLITLLVVTSIKVLEDHIYLVQIPLMKSLIPTGSGVHSHSQHHFPFFEQFPKVKKRIHS